MCDQKKEAVDEPFWFYAICIFLSLLGFIGVIIYAMRGVF